MSHGSGTLERGDLEPRRDVLAMCELNDALQRCHLRILPKTAVLRRYATFRCNSGGFDHRNSYEQYQKIEAMRYGKIFDEGRMTTWSSLNNTAKMGEMPCGVVPIFGGVLTKGGKLMKVNSV